MVRGGAIGDFVLTLPVFAAIKELFPNAHVEVMGYPAVTPLAVEGGRADAARNIDARPLASYFIRKGEPDSELSEYFAGFDIVISYLYDPDGFFRKNVTDCGDIQFIQGPHRPDDGEALHATEALLKPLETLAIFGADATPKLDLAAAGATGKGEVAVHPGSGSEAKNWPLERWRELLLRAREAHDTAFLVVGGEADHERMNGLRDELPEDGFRFLHHAPLLEVARELARCRAFVGHDSGIGHLAAAVGLPGMTLWGPTQETVWRPRSERFEIISDPAGLAGIEVAPVFNAFEKLLATSGG